jgi:hypothetical protein
MVTIDLLAALGKFKNLSDRETDHAYFMTKVPSVAPEAYLNIVYKPVAPEIRAELEKGLQFPNSLAEFYQHWNGARLFVGALSIYGCLPRNYLLYRADRFKVLPFNLREINHEFLSQTSHKNLICIGSYSYDRSIVCMNRKSQSIACYVGKQFAEERQTWPSLDQWLSDEITRLSFFFDECGNRLVPEEHLLPGPNPSPVN